MAVREKRELTEAQVKRLFEPITAMELFKVSCDSAKAKKERMDEVVNQAVMDSGYHPAGYGAWDYKIVRDTQGKYYATWYRGNTCD